MNKSRSSEDLRKEESEVFAVAESFGVFSKLKLLFRVSLRRLLLKKYMPMPIPIMARTISGITIPRAIANA